MDTADPWTDDRYHVETPERIDLEYDVASLGSRLLAAIVDSLITIVVAALAMFLGTMGLVVLAGFLGAMSRGVGISIDSGTLGNIAIVGAILLPFVVIWGYYVFFELVWHGQSPGKRWVGLRVIKEGGYPIGFVDSAIRNVVRLVDFLPFYYGVGAIVMFIDSRSRRLGDLAAGTLVVKERRELKLDSLAARPAPPSPMAASDPEADSSEGQILNLHRLTAADQSLLREYYTRRSSLAAPAGAALAAHLASAFARKLEHDLAGETAEAFLARLAEQMGKR